MEGRKKIAEHTFNLFYEKKLNSEFFFNERLFNRIFILMKLLGRNSALPLIKLTS
jgi:hypothetical protein